jgi:hypothetical protein
MVPKAARLGAGDEWFGVQRGFGRAERHGEVVRLRRIDPEPRGVSEVMVNPTPPSDR